MYFTVLSSLSAPSGCRSPETSRPPPASGHLPSPGPRADAPAVRTERDNPATVGPGRVATWNVNSAKQRVPRLLPWLDQRQPDVVCLQETKLTDDAFLELLGAELQGRGYATALYGEPQWNGVAILSRAGLDDVVKGIPGGPGFPNPEARAVAATCGGARGRPGYRPSGRRAHSD